MGIVWVIGKNGFKLLESKKTARVPLARHKVNEKGNTMGV